MNNARTPLFLMANLGSEVSRFLDAKQKKDQETSDRCYNRARQILEQLKASAEIPSRRDEIMILENVLSDFKQPKQEYTIDPAELKSYFLPFARRMMASR